MSRIKIKDLPKNAKISKEDMKKMSGGTFSFARPTLSLRTSFRKSFNTPTIVSGVRFNKGSALHSMEEEEEVIQP